jgi:beta-glucanase (GH16 family)
MYVLGGTASIHDSTVAELVDAILPDEPGDGYLPGWGYPDWRDEFNGSTLDTSTWTNRDQSTHGNLSYDWAVIDSDAVSVNDGKLRIRAEELDTPVESDGRTRYWSTGYLDTIDKQEAQYGRWEFRAKIPTTAGNSRGVWPAFWLRNDSLGEIDIMESWGDPPKTERDPDLSETSTVVLHESTNGGGEKVQATYEHRTLPGLEPYSTASGFHTWAVEYTPTYVKAYLDGELAVHIVPTGELVSGESGDYSWVWGPTFENDPWAIRLNLQMGDPYWSPDLTPSPLTAMPADYLIDYVRFYEYTP